MVKYDYLTEEEGEELKKEKLRLRFKPLNHYSGLAPYLREQIRQDAVKLIAEFNEANSTNYDLYKDGLKLVTTIDAEMQRYAGKSHATTHEVVATRFLHASGKTRTMGQREESP